MNKEAKMRTIAIFGLALLPTAKLQRTIDEWLVISCSVLCAYSQSLKKLSNEQNKGTSVARINSG